MNPQRRLRRSLGDLLRWGASLSQPSMSLSSLPHRPGPADVSLSEAAAGATRILFLRTDGIGDGLLSAGLLEPLARTFPHWQIQVLCPDTMTGVFEHHPNVQKVIPFNLGQYRGDRKAFRALNDQVESLGADLVLNTVRSRYPHTDRLAMAARARHGIAISDPTAILSTSERDASDGFYTHVYRPPTGSILLSESEVYQGFLSWLGSEAAYEGPRMACSAEDEAWARDFLDTEGLDPSGLILLMAGALHGVRYYRGYGEALRRAKIEKGALVALGAARDAVISQANLEAAGCRTLNLCGKTTLGQGAALMALARLALGAETGLAHLACAMGLPQVVLLGGGHFGRFMPYSPLTTFVSLPLDCFGCGWACRHSDIHCVKAVPVDLVAGAVEHAWAQGRSQARPVGVYAGPRATAAACQEAAWSDPRHRIHRPCDWIEIG